MTLKYFHYLSFHLIFDVPLNLLEMNSFENQVKYLKVKNHEKLLYDNL